jgi:hypothetical protein
MRFLRPRGTFAAGDDTREEVWLVTPHSPPHGVRGRHIGGGWTKSAARSFFSCWGAFLSCSGLRIAMLYQCAADDSAKIFSQRDPHVARLENVWRFFALRSGTSTNQNLAVTWIRRRQQHYFYLPLGTVCCRRRRFFFHIRIAVYRISPSGLGTNKPMHISNRGLPVEFSKRNEDNFYVGYRREQHLRPENLVEFEFLSEMRTHHNHVRLRRCLNQQPVPIRPQFSA